MTTAPRYTVRSYGIMEDAQGLKLSDGFLVVVPAGVVVTLEGDNAVLDERARPDGAVLQTNDYREAWDTANRLSRENGHEGGNVYAAGVVIGKDDVAPLARCESESRYGDGSFECPLKDAPRHTWTYNLAGYHPCNAIS